MSARVRRYGVGFGLIGGAAAVAVTLGFGGAHVGVVDQQVSLTATGGNTDLGDLLTIASTNFLDAKDLITGIDTTDLSGTLLTAVESVHRIPDILDRVVVIVDDHLSPAESAILAQSGPMAELVDQLFFAPLNQQWADASESMLTATQAFDTAVADGSISGVVTAEFQMLGVTFFEVIPAAFATVPVTWIGSLFDDVVPASDLSFLF